MSNDEFSSISNRRLFVALLLHALPISGALFLIASGFASMEPGAVRLPSKSEPLLWLAFPFPFNLVLWGMGYLVLPSFRRTAVKTVVAGISVNIVMAAVVFYLGLEAGLAQNVGAASLSKADRERVAQLLGAMTGWALVVWGALILLAVAGICWHTWRLTHSESGHVLGRPHGTP